VAEQEENILRPARRRRREISDPALAESGDGAEAAAAPIKRRGKSAVVPKAIQERFVRVKDVYYFKDGAVAFKDHGRKLTTKSENSEVVKSLVAIAQSRGWEQISIGGTERFRREAWFAAQAAGLTVRGYEPTEMDRARVVRLAVREPGAELDLEARFA